MEDDVFCLSSCNRFIVSYSSFVLSIKIYWKESNRVSLESVLRPLNWWPRAKNIQWFFQYSSDTWLRTLILLLREDDGCTGCHTHLAVCRKAGCQTFGRMTLIFGFCMLSLPSETPRLLSRRPNSIMWYRNYPKTSWFRFEVWLWTRPRPLLLMKI